MPDTSAKPKTREELEKEWWDRWWAEDYSWEGLANKNIEGTGGLYGEKNLQDYWLFDPATGQRRDEADLKRSGELIFGPGKQLWHAAHVPLTWMDGSAAKSEWNDSTRAKLRDLVVARLMAGVETKADDSGKIEGRNGRAQLRGIVLDGGCMAWPTSQQPSTIHLNCRDAWLTDWFAAGRTFGPVANFSRATFSGDTSFIGATLSGTTYFTSAIFSGEAGFEDAIFSGDAWFENTTFRHSADWRDVKFEKAAHYKQTKFMGLTNFDGASFRGPIRFEMSVAKDLISFARCTWPEAARDWHSAFKGMLFDGRAVFDGAGCRAFAAFDGAMFERPISFDVSDDATVTATFQDELQGAISAATIDANLWEADENFSRNNAKIALVSVSEKTLKLKAVRNIRLGELERGCRTLKQAMAAQTDKSREHMFYRFELMARHGQSTTPWQERWASAIYEAVSDYGTSITRPLMWLAFVWAIAALAYVLIGVAAAPDKIVPLLWSWNAFDLSLSRVFQPLTFWSAANLQDNALGLELVGQKDRGFLAFLVRFLGTLQSLISIILLFLSGLALRRRFQIN